MSLICIEILFIQYISYKYCSKGKSVEFGLPITAVYRFFEDFVFLLTMP